MVFLATLVLLSGALTTRKERALSIGLSRPPPRGQLTRRRYRVAEMVSSPNVTHVVLVRR